MSLSSVEAGLPPGFRFHPKDEELICDYLLKWVAGAPSPSPSPSPHPFPFLINVDLNKCEPWDIPEIACVGGKEWYFYSQRDRKYATGLRTNRATMSGYWKATGKDRPISRKSTLVGMRKTLVFYKGRAPKGHKTDWVMHEFRLHDPGRTSSHQPVVKEEDWVLCRVFFKNRREVPSKQGATSPAPGSPPYSSPQTLPGLMDQAYTAPPISDEQVSCFSNFNQTNPNFFVDLPLSQILQHPGPSKLFLPPNPSSFPDLLGINSYMMMNDDIIAAASNSSCNNFNSNNNSSTNINNNVIMKGSPVSFGEVGSCDSYLSEAAGLSSSMWINPYQC